MIAYRLSATGTLNRSTPANSINPVPLPD